jgi:hypothetical protein
MDMIPEPEPAPIGDTHPSWCAPGRCEIRLGGLHSSEPIVIKRDRGSCTHLMARLWGNLDRIWVELFLGEHGEGPAATLTVSLDQAEALRLGLGALLQQTVARPIATRRRNTR